MTAIIWPTTTSPGLKPSEGAGRLINCYSEPLGPGARDGSTIHRVPGMASFGTTGRTGYRGMIEVSGTLYAAFSGKLEKWSSSAGGASTNVGNLNGTKKGFFARNNAATPDKVFVDPDGNIATFTPASVTNSFDADLPAVNSVDQLDGYFLFTTGSGQIWASDLNSTSVSALSFTTEQTSNGLVRGVAWSGRYIAFGNATTSIYVDAGTTPFPLSRNAVITTGIAGPYCVAGHEVGFSGIPHWVGNDNRVHRLDGYQATAVSPADLDGLIEAVTDKTTIEMCSYISRGHKFIEVSCPAWTWVLNTDNGQWHEKAKYLGTRSRISQSLYVFNSLWLTGDTDTGNLFKVTNATHLDDTSPIVCEVWSKPVQGFPANIRVPSMWIDAALGVGQSSGTDPTQTDPSIQIDWSDDGGLSFETPRIRQLGRQSEAKQRIRVNQCGRSRSQGRVVRVRQADPVHFGLMGGEMATDLKAA